VKNDALEKKKSSIVLTSLKKPFSGDMTFDSSYLFSSLRKF
jgi:hypothetical protein